MSESGNAPVGTSDVMSDRNESPADVSATGQVDAPQSPPKIIRRQSSGVPGELLSELKRIGLGDTSYLSMLRALKIRDLETLASIPEAQLVEVRGRKLFVSPRPAPKCAPLVSSSFAQHYPRYHASLPRG
jgi:hypothetical protein